MRHLFVVDSLDKQIQNEKELNHLASAGGGGLFCVCVESINLTVTHCDWLIIAISEGILECP